MACTGPESSAARISLRRLSWAGSIAILTLCLPGLLAACGQADDAGRAVPAAVATDPADPAGAKPAAKPDAPGAPAPAKKKPLIDPRLSSTAPGTPTEGKQPGENSPPSPLVVEPEEIDLGVMAVRSVKEGTARLRNPTDKPVAINHVRSSCTCTTTEPYKGKVLQPGESIELKAVVDGKGTLGPRTLHLFVVLDEFSPMEIPVKVEVTQPVRADPARIKLFLEEGDVPQGVVTIDALDGQPFRILSTTTGDPIYVDNYKPGDAPLSKYKLKWDVSKFVTPKPTDSTMPWWWVVETDRAEAQLVPLRIRSFFTGWANRPEFSLSTGRKWSWGGDLYVNAGVTPPGTPAELTVTTKHLGNLNLISVQSRTPELIPHAEIVGSMVVDGERQYTFRITPNPDLRGLYQGLLLFTDNEGRQLGLWVLGTAR